MRAFVVLLGLVLAVAAAAADGVGERGGLAVTQDGQRVGNCETVELPLSDFAPMSRSGTRCTWGVAASAGAITPPLTFSTCFLFDGSVTIYLASSGCESQNEVMAQVPLKNGGVYGQLSCKLLGGTTGGATLAVQVRHGTCGSSGAASTVVCSMGTGTSACQSGLETVSLANGACLSLGAIGGGGPFPAPRGLSCSIEKVG